MIRSLNSGDAALYKPVCYFEIKNTRTSALTFQQKSAAKSFYLVRTSKQSCLK